MNYYEKTGRLQEVELVKRLSPVAWTHINLYGKYDFLSDEEMIDMDDVISRLTQTEINLYDNQNSLLFN